MTTTPLSALTLPVGMAAAAGLVGFLLAFGLTVALGLRYLGVLLMGSLIIIPAVTARQLARGLNWMLVIAAALAVAATLVGLYASPILRVPAGPVTIAAAALFFFLSLVARRRG